MMKKYLFMVFLGIFLTLGLFLPTTTRAQNTFSCAYVAIGCRVDIYQTSCETGYEPVASMCEEITGGVTACMGNTFDCVLSDEISDTGLIEAGVADPTFGCGGKGIDSAIGCIPVANTNDAVLFFLRWGAGIGGGIAFLLIIAGGFQVMTSAGDPEKAKAGQALITSAVSGLILILFSVFILRIIGVDILKLPGIS